VDISVENISLKKWEEFLKNKKFFGKVLWMVVKDGLYTGGYAETLDIGLSILREYYNINNDCKLGLGDYIRNVRVYEHECVLHKLGIISDEEYNESIETD